MNMNAPGQQLSRSRYWIRGAILAMALATEVLEANCERLRLNLAWIDSIVLRATPNLIVTLTGYSVRKLPQFPEHIRSYLGGELSSDFDWAARLYLAVSENPVSIETLKLVILREEDYQVGSVASRVDSPTIVVSVPEEGEDGLFQPQGLQRLRTRLFRALGRLYFDRATDGVSEHGLYWSVTTANPKEAVDSYLIVRNRLQGWLGSNYRRGVQGLFAEFFALFASHGRLGARDVFLGNRSGVALPRSYAVLEKALPKYAARPVELLKLILDSMEPSLLREVAERAMRERPTGGDPSDARIQEVRAGTFGGQERLGVIREFNQHSQDLWEWATSDDRLNDFDGALAAHLAGRL